MNIDPSFIANTFKLIRASRTSFEELGFTFGDMIDKFELQSNNLLLVAQDMSSLGQIMTIKADDAKDMYEAFLEEVTWAAEDPDGYGMESA